MIAEILQADPAHYQDESGNWLPSSRIASLLTTGDELSNPDPQADVPAPVAVKCSRIRAMIPADVAKAFNDPALASLHEAFRANDLESIREWTEIGAKRQKITADQLAAIEDQIDNGTVPDPDYPATIRKAPPMQTVSEAEVRTAIEELG